jgi:hypothetical protein
MVNSENKLSTLLLGFVVILFACKSNPGSTGKIEETRKIDTFSQPKETFSKKRPKNNSGQTISDSIYGDTIWIYPYRMNYWTDTVTTEDYQAVFTVRVDTTDYIIDTIESPKGSRIAVGYNHYYTLTFSKKNKPWFTVSFNKKKDIESLIGGTDFWLESNLDVFRRLVYNEKYKKFVVEFDINPLNNFGSVYYFVFDTQGKIDYTGTAYTWGGSDPDGISFLTGDNKAYVTCYEIYVFESNTSVAISDFASMADFKTFGIMKSDYRWLHGLRNLSNNSFLAVFNRNDFYPEYNALIMNTDTIIINRFKYYGLMEDMDAILLFKYDALLRRFYLYDTDREKLICINETDMSEIKEFDVNKMFVVDGDTMSSEKYVALDFEVFGTYRFYTTQNDTLFYCDIDTLE